MGFQICVPMKKIQSLSILLAVSVGLTLAHPDYSDSWEEFKQKFKKQYDSEEDEGYRESVWSSTVQMISEHNSEYEAGEHDYNLGENELADLTPDEIKERMNGLIMSSADTADGEVMVTEAELSKLNKTGDRRDTSLRSRTRHTAAAAGPLVPPAPWRELTSSPPASWSLSVSRISWTVPGRSTTWD